MNYNQGYLHLFIGGVRSGKSSRGLSTYVHYQGLDKYHPVIVIPEWTIREDDPVYRRYNISMDNVIKVTRDQTVEQSLELLKDYNVIIIDECQFYPHLKEVVLELLDQKKKVYACGLDGNVKGQPMGEVHSLIFYSNKVTKCTGQCSVCIREDNPIINDSIMSSLRNKRDGEYHDEIGGLDVYDPVCRDHYRR